MQRALHLLLAVVMLFGLTGLETSATAQAGDALDLANIPLTVQQLPEEGYQVMAGAYLASDEIARFIADPRNLDEESVQSRLGAAFPSRAYVLALVLPEDRAWQDSPILALQQTTAYLVDEDSADALVELLLDHSNVAFVEPGEAATAGATTVHWMGESGEQLRTVVRDGNVVLEIVSLDATGEPDATGHALIVESTLERLEALRLSESVGISSMVLSLQPSNSNADFFNAQQSGVHGIYWFRDNNVQPAVGQIGADQTGISPAVESIYFSNYLVDTSGGVASISVSLTEFDDPEAAQGWYESLVAGNPGNQLVDPYYTIALDETWTDQGVLGVFRVTGTYKGQSYSGIVEIREQGDVVVVVGYRTIGSMLPDATIASSLMDHQLDCLLSQVVCDPYDLTFETAPAQATPIVDSASPGSKEFGWSLPELDDEWIVDEQFSESGYDRIGLRNGVSIFEFESVINHHGEPLQCVLDEQKLLEEFEEHSVITVWEDADGNTVGGNTSDHAWIVYRVEPLAEERADQEYVIRIDCFSLVPNSANLVMRHIAPVDYWDEEQSKANALRDSIVFPGSSGVHGKLLVSAHDRRTTMIIPHIAHRAA